MREQIEKEISDSCNIINHIRFSINNGNCRNCPYCKELNSLYRNLTKLVSTIQIEFPVESECMQMYLPKLKGVSHINPYDFGGIIATMNIIEEKYKRKYNNTEFKKIFISHSSEDKRIVQAFIDDILQLGTGLKDEDIFCTSIEEMGIKNGEDIKEHIHKNIKNSDFSYLLISDNYKKSEICLNEMGDVWAYNNNVRLYLLPGTQFTSLGWLYDKTLAEKIDDTITLDKLHFELEQYYSLQQNPITWSRQRKKFLSEIK